MEPEAVANTPQEAGEETTLTKSETTNTVVNSGGVEDGLVSYSERKIAPSSSVRPAASFQLWERS